jgi:hypothetical protein
VEKAYPFLAAESVLFIAQDETQGAEEVALARAIAADDDIALRREGLDLRLVFVAGALLSAGCDAMHNKTYLLKPWIVICLT